MMDPVTVGIICVGLLIVFVLSGIRIAYAMGFITILGIYMMSGNVNRAVSVVGVSFVSGIKDLSYAVLPLFMMVGVVLSVAELGEDIYQSMEVITRKVPGGLGMATVMANAVFAAIVGASIASAAAFSKIAYGPMTKAGYDRKLAVGSIAGSSVLGMLIPPSLLFILYGVLTGESVGKMFMAGILPGIVLAFIFCVQIYLQVKRKPEIAPVPKDLQKMGKKQAVKRLLHPWGSYLLIIVVLGGIYTGVFTPTEAGAVGVLGSFLIAFFYKRLTFERVKKILLDTGSTTASILLLLCTAKMFTRVIALSGMVNSLNAFLIASAVPIMVVIVGVLIISLALGCIIDSASIFLLVLPMITPILIAHKIDLIWFGVIFTVVVEMGLITPPFGVCVFTVKSSLGDKVTLQEVFNGSAPYLISMAILVVLMFVFPALPTYLPSIM